MGSEKETVFPESQVRLLIVVPDTPLRLVCSEIASNLGYEVEALEDLDCALERLSDSSVDIVLLSIPYGSDRGVELAAAFKQHHPQIPIIAMTGSTSASNAVEAMRSGASDYLVLPFDLPAFSAALERAAALCTRRTMMRTLHEQVQLSSGLGRIIGRSEGMERMYRILPKVANSNHSVLICGESGTGKEVVARTIHELGPNAEKEFLPIDCGTLVPTLIESDLFGHEKDAFTGANHAKHGLLVSAQGGTVFLDEIGELPLDLQSKLLRALQEKEVRPVGSTRRLPIRARILAATNRDLAEMVDKGQFRKDLYYRINVTKLQLPPLRDRHEDIPLLAAHFMERLSQEFGNRFRLSDLALRTIMQHDWPGNVRELANALERACALCDGSILELKDFPTILQQEGLEAECAILKKQKDGNEGTIVKTLAEMERHAILKAIRALNGDKIEAARRLGIGKTTLYRKLKEYGIEVSV